jgi:hypothetical protein
MIAERDGVHCTSTLKFVRLRPSSANVSMRGVAAPRIIPPPLNPGSPQPKLSKNTKKIFGFSWALAFVKQANKIHKREKHKIIPQPLIFFGCSHGNADSFDLQY